MLAARDQENLVHGLQAAAASKPLNQGIRQNPPKTPNNKGPKTPFKLPLNDENNTIMLGGGAKLGLKPSSRGNASLMTAGKKEGLADKNMFVTPMGMSITAHALLLSMILPYSDRNRSIHSSPTGSQDDKC